MRFATDGGVRRCAVGAQLTSAGEMISSQVLPCSAIPDSTPVEVFRFTAQPDSNGRTYEIDLTLSEAGGDSPLVWAGIDGGGRLPGGPVRRRHAPGHARAAHLLRRRREGVGPGRSRSATVVAVSAVVPAARRGRGLRRTRVRGVARARRGTRAPRVGVARRARRREGTPVVRDRSAARSTRRARTRGVRAVHGGGASDPEARRLPTRPAAEPAAQPAADGSDESVAPGEPAAR